jgi:hypothetical protein
LCSTLFHTSPECTPPCTTVPYLPKLLRPRHKLCIFVRLLLAEGIDAGCNESSLSTSSPAPVLCPSIVLSPPFLLCCLRTHILTKASFLSYWHRRSQMRTWVYKYTPIILTKILYTPSMRSMRKHFHEKLELNCQFNELCAPII